MSLNKELDPFASQFGFFRIKAHDLTQFHFLPIADLVPIHAQFFWVVSQTTSEKSEKWQNVGNNLGGGKIQIIELSIDPFFKMRP